MEPKIPHNSDLKQKLFSSDNLPKDKNCLKNWCLLQEKHAPETNEVTRLAMQRLTGDNKDCHY